MGFRQNINRSMLARALLSNFALVAVSVVLLTGLFLLVQLAAIRRQMEVRAEILAGFAATQSEFAMLVGNHAEIERIARNSLSVEDVLFVVVTDRSGDSIRVARPGFAIGGIPATPIAADNVPPSIHRGGTRPFLEVVRPVLTQTESSVVEWEEKKTATRLGAVWIGFSLEQQEKLWRRSLRFSVPIAVLSLVLILAVQYTQLRRLLDPLKGLITFTRQIGQGRLTGRAPVGRLDEVGRLTEAFNRMVEELGSTTVSKDYMNNIIRSMGESLIVIGADQTIRTVNQATLSMLGYAEEELLGRHASLVLSSAQSEDAAGSAGVERVYRLKNGTFIPVLFSASMMCGENGVSEGQVWLAQDITARKLAEEQLREAKLQAETANRAKSDLLSRTSHELRTPLNAILGFGQLLEMAELRSDDRESVDQIMKAGRHLLCLINELLDIAGIESGRRTLSKESVQVGDAARESLDLIRTLAEDHHIQIRAELEAWPNLCVLADSRRLRQVLLNLLSNAIKYNREGGAVSLSCEPGRQEKLRILIHDTGPGIPPEGLAKLFVPFERLGAAEAGIEGTGLGLAFSKIFVEAMGGRIGVDSIVGQGTTFWLELPLAETSQAKLERDPECVSRSRYDQRTPKAITPAPENHERTFLKRDSINA